MIFFRLLNSLLNWMTHTTWYDVKIKTIIQFYIPAYGQLHTRSINILLHSRKLKACGQGRHPSNIICKCYAPSFYFRIREICYDFTAYGTLLLMKHIWGGCGSLQSFLKALITMIYILCSRFLLFKAHILFIQTSQKK